MVKFIPLELTLGLRSKILRQNAPLEQCVFPTDKITGVFHIAYYQNDEIASVATFFPNNLVNYPNLGYQLRGMATNTNFVGKGFGKQLVTFAVNHIRKINTAYIWCNARASAVGFYQKLGFEIISEQFEIEGVGPHFTMIFNLNNI